jgi:hypothetical protein
MVDSQQKSPVKRRRMQSSADLIIQEVIKGGEKGHRTLLRTILLSLW